MKYKNNNSNSPMPGVNQASGLNQTCNGQNKSKKNKHKNNQNGCVETNKNKINESKTDKNGKATEEVAAANTEIVLKKTENSTTNCISAGEDSSLLTDSQTNDILAIDASNKHSDSASTLSSLSVSPTSSLVDYIDNVKSLDNECDVVLSSSEKAESEANAEDTLTEEIKKFEFSSPSKVKEFIPKSNNELLSVDVGFCPIKSYALMMGYCDMPANYNSNTDSDSPNPLVENASPIEASTSMPESPVESVDSGIAPSVVQDFASGGQESLLEDEQTTYSFEICSRAVGRLIGKKGKFVNCILEQTGAVVMVVNHPASPDDKLCNIHGTSRQISAALGMITDRFPQDQYRGFSIEKYTYPPVTVQFPESFRLRLPQGVLCDIQVCKVTDSGQFFVHIPTHPSYYCMFRMFCRMNVFYSECSPKLECPQLGNICAIKSNNGWCRAEVIELLPESDQCVVRLCDFGGYQCVPRSSLFLIHGQFMDYPFQAIQCSFADIEPADGEDWTEEAKNVLDKLTRGIICGVSVGCSDTGSYLLRLHKKITNCQYLNINQHLLDCGLARLITPPSNQE